MVGSFFPNSLAHQMDYFDDNYSNLSNQILNIFINYSNISHTNNSLQLPETLQFNTNSLIMVIVYCIFFLFSAFGNLTVFYSLRKLRRSHSRINLMIFHLAIADLFVTFIMIPLEIGWRITVQWIAGNIACKIFLVFRAFGLYLSSNVIVCISLDRYFAILYPLKVANAKQRGRIMLFVAWIASFIWAFPQGIVFHVSTHPNYPNFTQCVSFGFFSNNQQEVAYNLFCVSAMYFIPLAVIIFVYTAIMWKIFHKSRYSNKSKGKSNAKMQLRRSEITNVERARSRTLRLAVTIVLVFLWCWTPYVVMTLWYMIDRKSAENVPNWLQDTLFMMAVSNSCVNPIVYGSYAMGLRQKCIKIIQFFGCAKSQTSLQIYRYDVERIRTSEYI